MVTDFRINGDERLVVHRVVATHTAADNISAEAGYEVLEHWARCLVEQVVTVFGRVRNHHVHLVELFTCNGVGDKRCLVERLVVSRLVDNAG